MTRIVACNTVVGAPVDIMDMHNKVAYYPITHTTASVYQTCIQNVFFNKVKEEKEMGGNCQFYHCCHCSAVCYFIVIRLLVRFCRTTDH